MKKWLALFLALAMLFALTACASEQGDDDTTQSPSSNTSDDASDTASYVIGGHTIGTGAYSFEKYRATQELILDICGDEYLFADNEFTPDNIVPDAQSLVASGADGLVVQKIFDAQTLTVTEMLADNGVYFSLTEHNGDDEIMEQNFYPNEYFVGCTGLNNADAGTLIAELALANGMRTAIIFAEMAGSANSDAREAAFTEAFVAGGGTVLGTCNCQDATEAIQKGEDLYLANPDVDMIFGVGAETVLGATSVMERYPDADVAIYGVTLDSTIAEYIKSGDVVACYDDQQLYCMFATVMLAHKLHTGETFVGEDGRPITVLTRGTMVTAENVDLFMKIFGDGCAYTDEEIYHMVFEATSEEFVEILDSFSFEERVQANYEAGVITAEEAAVAGVTVD